MEFYFSGLSDVGNVRNNNEDYLFAGSVGENAYLFIVADGMGGHRAGEIASRKAVTTFVRLLEEATGGDIREELKRIIGVVNEQLIQEGNRASEKSGMGTTLSVLYIKDDMAYIAHVGDSRIYRCSNRDGVEKLDQLTEDHSFVGRLLKDGFITEEEARNHPRRNVLYQSIGLKKDINVQIREPFAIQPGDKFLLCSDGLYGVITDKELAWHLNEKSISNITKHLIKKAKSNGGPDNITAIVVSTEKDEDIPADSTGTIAGKTFLEDTDKIIISSTLPKKNRRKVILILVAIILLLLALVVFLVIKNTDTGKKSSGPKAAAELKLKKE